MRRLEGESRADQLYIAGELPNEGEGTGDDTCTNCGEPLDLGECTNPACEDSPEYQDWEEVNEDDLPEIQEDEVLELVEEPTEED